ncbi:MAG: hypothetical protein D3903_07370 [Candidatus Electrothrix sp. GM3_4]|nr:hypothetical protein [Candidatus Electrothrix sp. GM3_4]
MVGLIYGHWMMYGKLAKAFLSGYNSKRAECRPGVTGGPWPEEWVDIFERWIATGSNDRTGHHLITVAPDEGSYEIRRIFGGKLRLQTTVTVPSDGYRVWFNIETITSTSRTYRLVAEPPYPVRQDSPRQELVSEKMPAAGLKRVIIIDADMTRQLDIDN